MFVALELVQVDDVKAAIRNVVIANRILAHQNVLDAYGHVSVRHPLDPSRYFLSRSLSPGIVTEADIVEFHLDGAPTSPDEKRPLYVERFIHGAAYERRPDVMAVVHSHAESVIPFSILGRYKLRPVLHTIGNMGAKVPVWDIADIFGDRTAMVVTNMEQGRDLARCLDCNRLALMRGHGFVCTGSSIYDLVRLAVYIPKNARVQMAAIMMCRTDEDENDIRYVSQGEIEARLELDAMSPAMLRGWEFWAREAGCGDMLGKLY